MSDNHSFFWYFLNTSLEMLLQPVVGFLFIAMICAPLSVVIILAPLDGGVIWSLVVVVCLVIFVPLSLRFCGKLYDKVSKAIKSHFSRFIGEPPEKFGFWRTMPALFIHFLCMLTVFELLWAYVYGGFRGAEQDSVRPLSMLVFGLVMPFVSMVIYIILTPFILYLIARFIIRSPS